MGKLTVSELGVKPLAPSSGNRSLYPKADGWYDLDDQGIESSVSMNNVYGSEYLGESSVGGDTNTLNTFKTYLGLAYPAGLATIGHKYEIEFTALTRCSVVSRNHICRIALDGNTLETEIAIEHKDSGGDIRVPVGYKYIIDGSQLIPTGGFIDFDFRSQKSGDTSYVYSCTLTFKRVK
jgi:hypothetical protein